MEQSDRVDHDLVAIQVSTLHSLHSTHLNNILMSSPRYSLSAIRSLTFISHRFFARTDIPSDQCELLVPNRSSHEFSERKFR